MPSPDPASELVTQAARLVRTTRVRREQPAGVRVLSILDQHGPLGVGALAVLDGISQPTASSQVANLVERGWVSKEAHPDDARATLVALTTEGASVLAHFRAENAAMVSRALAGTGHSADDLARAVAVLADVVAALADDEADGAPSSLPIRTRKDVS